MQTRATLPKIEILKKEIILLLPDVKSSHRVEAMARGLGWNSNATLRADLADGPQVRTVDEARFTTYLTEHGFPGVQNGVLAAAVRRADIAAAREAIQAVMEREPTLTVHGYNTYKRMPLDERQAEFGRNRRSMVTDYHVGQFLMAQEFLLTAPRTQRVTKRVSSYGYKEQVEDFQKRKNAPDSYVENGMFIAAALDMGFVVARIEGSPNAYFNIGRPKPDKPPGRSAILASAANGPTWDAWRNIMVAAVNAGLEQGHFGLEPDDNRFEGQDHVYRFDLEGLPGIAYVRAMADGELMLHAAINSSKQAEQTIRVGMAGLLGGEGFSEGRMERLDRKYLHSVRPYTSFRTTLLFQVSEMKVEPNGFTTMPLLQV